MHKTAYAFAKRKEHDFLVVGSRQQCIFHIFHKHKPTTLTKLRAIGSGTIPSSVTSTSTSQPPHFRRHQDQGMSNKLLVSMKCERLQGIQPLMMESFLFLKNDTSNDDFFFLISHSSIEMKGFFLLSTYDLIEAEYSTEFNKASFPGFKGQFFVKTRDVFDTRFFAYHFHKY
jgi:hypothetical protein